jgi:hypothetical protein
MAAPQTVAQRYRKMIEDEMSSVMRSFMQDLPEEEFDDAQRPSGTTSGLTAGGNILGANTATPEDAPTPTADPAAPPNANDPNAGGGAGIPEAEPGLAELTGWAGEQNFNPTELEHIFQNPQAILPYIFAQMQAGSPGYNRLRNLEWDPLALLTMTKGATSLLGDQSEWGGAGGYANFLNEVYNQIGTKGGQGINAAALIRNIFAQPGTATGNSETALGNMLGAGDATQQSRTLYNLVRDVTQMGMNPLAGQAYQAAMMNALDRYNTNQLTRDSEDVTSAVDYINANMPWLTALG